jgi:broad specificity phosphatase PhoE
MSRLVYFITHPDVVIDPAVPVPRWPLSERGLQRMRRLLRQPWIAQLEAIYCSMEQKAIDGAAILSEATGLPFHQLAALGENDRSLTGYLRGAEFQTTVEAFFTRRTRASAAGNARPTLRRASSPLSAASRAARPATARSR